MLNRFRRVQTVLLIFCLCIALTLPAYAGGTSTQEHAALLSSLNLFRGTGTASDGSPVYSLHNLPTRLQGLIMLVRLLGAEEEALALDGITPFTDVSNFTDAARYISYAYENGITNGTSPVTFTPGGTLTVNAYMAFLLRALGYTETDEDFSWGQQLEFALSIGMITQKSVPLLRSAELTRGIMVDLSYAALTCQRKNESRTLAEKLCQDGIFTEEQGIRAGVLGHGAGWTYDYVLTDDSTVDYERKNVYTTGGNVTAHVLTVNVSNPSVTVRAAMVDNTLGHTAPFPEIVENSGALVVVNGNFFSSYSDFKVPVGHVMSDGELLYADSGLSSLGASEDGTIQIGRPGIFTRLRSGPDEWSIYSVNTEEQENSGSVLYTPAYGERVTFRNDGWALITENNVIAEYYSVSEGGTVTIPRNGYVAYMGTSYASTSYFRIPQIGSEISMEYYMRTEDDNGFTLDGVENMVSGAPRLVEKGEIVTELEEGFTESRFTTAVSPRTAAGVNDEGKLLLVSVPGGATIQQMRELMLALGCVDAINLDGGASCAMYYQGATLASPTRDLTVTLQVFVDE